MTICPSTWNHSFARPTMIFNKSVFGRFSRFSSYADRAIYSVVLHSSRLQLPDDVTLQTRACKHDDVVPHLIYIVVGILVDDKCKEWRRDHVGLVAWPSASRDLKPVACVFMEPYLKYCIYVTAVNGMAEIQQTVEDRCITRLKFLNACSSQIHL
jgi:hypothetical protein